MISPLQQATKINLQTVASPTCMIQLYVLMVGFFVSCIYAVGVMTAIAFIKGGIKTDYMINKSNYINFSGGAYGADQTWDKLGRKYGFNNHLHFQPNDYHEASNDVKNQIDLAVTNAAEALGRPEYFIGIDLVRRNWFQVAGASTVFAISTIITIGTNKKNHRQVVSGGTGWAVEMAIQMEKPVYVFDLNKKHWYQHSNVGFEMLAARFVPRLTEHYAGIGTRQITAAGIEAIRQCYLLLLSL